MRREYSKQLAKTISRMDSINKKRIHQGIQNIPQGDIKPFKSSPGSYRLRVGNWRIIFSYPDNNTILIEEIGLRGQIYK